MRSFPRPRWNSIGNNTGTNILSVLRAQENQAQYNNVHRFNRGELSPRRRFYSIYNRNRNRVAPQLQNLIFDQPDRIPIGRNFGRYKAICKRHAVLGPGKCYLALSIVVMLLLVSLLAILHVELAVAVGSFTPYCGYILWIFTTYFLLKTALTDPGIIPRNISLTRYTIMNGHMRMNQGFLPTYCKVCKVRRPPRTYHCKECDICIRRQDFHLTALGTCIGERNFRSYYLFNLFVNGLSIYTFITHCIYLSLKYEFERAHRRHGPWSLYYSLAVVNVIISMCLIALPQTGILMLLYRFYLIAKDRTAREEFRVIFYGRKENRFGIKKSFYQTFKEHLFPNPLGMSYLTSRYNYGPDFGLEFPNMLHWNMDVESPDYLLNEFPFGRDNRRFGLDQWDPLSFEEEEFQSRCNEDLLNANMAKRKTFLSMPMIHNGSLRTLPSARHKLPKKPKHKDYMKANLKHHQDFLELPKYVADNQFYQANKISRSLSLGDLPKTTWNETAENEMLQQARANQILQIIELLRVRDRIGLIHLGRRINIGALLGIDDLDPDFLQIIELNNNGIPIVRGRQRGILRLRGAQGITPRLPRQPARNQTNHIGINQMVAAGLVSRREGTIIRDMIPGRDPNANFPVILPPRAHISRPVQVLPVPLGLRHPLQATVHLPFPSQANPTSVIQVPNNRVIPIESNVGNREVRINMPSSSTSGNRERVALLAEDLNNNQNETGSNSNRNTNERSNSSTRGIVFHMNRFRRRGN